MLRRIVGNRFQVLFHSPPGVLFTFPSRYLSAIGHQGVFRLSGWSRQIRTEFQGFRTTWGNAQQCQAYVYRGVTFCAVPFQSTSTSLDIYDCLTNWQHSQSGPTTPHMQRLPAITHVWFGLFRVRSPLLTESRLFSFPVGTEMFHFPTFPPAALCVQAEVAGHYSGFFRGFPIRRSPDRSSFTSSPGLIAGYNVLRRLLVPRHPPTALSSLLLTTKMLASTVKFSRCGRQTGRRLRRRYSAPLEGQMRKRPNPQDSTACLGNFEFSVEVPLLIVRKY